MSWQTGQAQSGCPVENQCQADQSIFSDCVNHASCSTDVGFGRYQLHLPSSLKTSITDGPIRFGVTVQGSALSCTINTGLSGPKDGSRPTASGTGDYLVHQIEIQGSSGAENEGSAASKAWTLQELNLRLSSATRADGKYVQLHCDGNQTEIHKKQPTLKMLVSAIDAGLRNCRACKNASFSFTPADDATRPLLLDGVKGDAYDPTK